MKQGKPKKGRRQWHKSKRYQQLAAKKKQLERRKSAYAKSQNRRVVNEILKHGKNIKTEKVSVKGWQKRYGKAISAKSPGFVQSELLRKAEKAGGTVIKFSTRKTALSQTHLNGERIKKSLLERGTASRWLKDTQFSLIQRYFAGFVYLLLGITAAIANSG